MNIEGNLQTPDKHRDFIDDVMVVDVVLFYQMFSCIFHKWSQLEAILFTTWIFRILHNGFHVRHLAILQTETEA